APLTILHSFCRFFFFQAEDGIRDYKVTGVQTCALPISIALQRGTKLAQTLLVMEEAYLARPLERNGFRYVTDLWYLRHALDKDRSEERRVGKECRCRWSTEH